MIKKIALVVTPTGAVVEERIFKGKPLYTGKYEKGKVNIFDADGKKLSDQNSPVVSKPVDKKADKKEPKNDKAAQVGKDADVQKVLGNDRNG